MMSCTDPHTHRVDTLVLILNTQDRLHNCINVLILLQVLVLMETAIQQTIDYTRERKAFGKSILDNQYVHFRLAELETEVEALRSMIYRATGKNL